MFKFYYSLWVLKCLFWQNTDVDAGHSSKYLLEWACCPCDCNKYSGSWLRLHTILGWWNMTNDFQSICNRITNGKHGLAWCSLKCGQKNCWRFSTSSKFLYVLLSPLLMLIKVVLDVFFYHLLVLLLGP